MTVKPPEIDLIRGDFYANDVHTSYAWLRENAPIYYDEKNNLYALSLYEDVMTVSKNTDLYSSKMGFRPDSPPMPMMACFDRPEHLVRRNLVSRGFTPRQVSMLEPRVREVCVESIETALQKRDFDFVTDIAAPLPMIIIAALLGVKDEDHGRLLRWSDDIMCALGSDDPELIGRQASAAAEWSVYNAAVVADRRSKPLGDDLMSILVHAEIDGERLDDQSILMESLLILIGGDETTRHVLTGGMHQLLLHPDQYQQLIDDPSKIPVAVEEMLRWVTPLQNMMRTVARETELRGQQLKPGDRVLMMYGAANRDPSVFERPEEFDCERNPNPHVAFGGNGSHICLGSSLARLELRVMFEELAARMPDLKLASDAEPKLRPANFVVGLEELPVKI
jgi:cytochrome P450 family 142 subfamily A polypeptide 1